MEQLSFDSPYQQPRMASRSHAAEALYFGYGVTPARGTSGIPAASTPVVDRNRAVTSKPVVAGAAVTEETGNVTEIILPQSQVENFQLLLPMLTQLTQEERWLAWIDPPAALVQKWQQHHGIVPGQLLVLRSSEQHDALEMAERALAAGTCHAVILWSGKLTRKANERLEQASLKGRSHGVILRKR